jgi:1,4-alpha-glucan branching enzyme
MSEYVKRLNLIYRQTPALYEADDSWEGFEWLNADDRDTSVFAFMRMGGDSRVVCVANFTAQVRYDYYVAMPDGGTIELLLNSDDTKYGGAGVSPENIIKTVPMEINGKGYCAKVTLPPLSALYFRYQKGADKQKGRNGNDE